MSRANNINYLFIIFLSFSLLGCGIGLQIHKSESKSNKINFNNEKLTFEEMRDKYGEPDSIYKISEDTVEWYYNDDLHYSGVTLVLGIPILPLVVPTGYHYTKYKFKKGIAIEKGYLYHAQTYTPSTFIGCASIPLGHGGHSFCSIDLSK